MRDKLKSLDYKNSVAFISRNASKALEKALDAELLRTSGLPGAKWKVVIALAIRNGLSQKELADFLSLDASSLVPVIDRLEQDQFVTRKPDPKDRRNNRIFATKKSESIVGSVVDSILNLRKIAYRNIPVRDIETTKAVLGKVIENTESFALQKKHRNSKKKESR